jgi:hypothetical protein
MNECHHFEPQISDFEGCPVTLSGADQLNEHCIKCVYSPFKEEAVKQILSEVRCWLCGGRNPDTKIYVERETPGGKPCPEKQVEVHFSCYMDIAP